MKKIDKNNNDIEQKKAAKDIFLDYMPYIVIIILVIILRTYIVTPIMVNGTSMDPTLKQGETMLLNKLGKTVKGINRFDIVVVKTSDTYIIKRVIGLPGESVACIDGKIYINEKLIEDNYGSGVTEDFEEVKIANDEYFVMGDNREVSKDSRIIGPVKDDKILGKTNIILFPFSKFGYVED